MSTARTTSAEAAMRAVKERFLAVQGHAALAAHKAKALDWASARGLPLPNEEDWKYSNVRALYAALLSESFGATRELIRAPESSASSATVFVRDGQIETSGALPEEIEIVRLSEAASSRPHVVSQALASASESSFAALSVALASEGLFVRVAPSTRALAPVELVFEAGRQTHLPVVVQLDPNARATIVESVKSAGASILNSFVHASIGERAKLAYYARDEAGARAHVARFDATCDRDASLDAFTLDAGGLATRKETCVTLRGPGASAHLAGLSLVARDSTIDQFTRVHHRATKAQSRQTYRAIVEAGGSSGFTGRVVVDKGADGTDAAQSSKNLLLSDRAAANTRPQLEIYARDVKCSHGATVGQLDPQQIFYLCSRGIGADQARRILTFAFAAEALSEIPDLEVRRSFARTAVQALGADPQLLGMEILS